MNQQALLDEFCAASECAQKHLTWLKREFCLPDSVLWPFGKSVLGLNRCRLSTEGLYQPDMQGEKAIIVAETFSDIPEKKIGIAEIIDLIAIPFTSRNRWFQRTNKAFILGLENLCNQNPGNQIVLHETPLTWLQAGGNGLCILDHGAVDPWAIIRSDDVVVENAALLQTFFKRAV